MKATTPVTRTWIIQIYFVVATLIGLLLIVIASVNLVNLVTKQALGVKDYPMSRVPMSNFAQQSGLSREQLTTEQQKKFDEMAVEYDRVLAEQDAYNQEEQSRKREIATSLAMLIVGIPVFAMHAPHVFRKNQA